MTNPTETPEGNENINKNEPAGAPVTPTDSAEEKPLTIEELNAENDELYQQTLDLGAALNRTQEENRALNQKVIEKDQQIDAIKIEATRTIERNAAKFEEEKKVAISGFVKDMLPFIDTYEDGLTAISEDDRKDPKFAKLAQGFESNLNKLKDLFNKYGVKTINPINEDFDSQFHMAAKTEPKDGVDSQTVTQVLKKGYEMNGRLIRTAIVVITP